MRSRELTLALAPSSFSKGERRLTTGSSGSLPHRECRYSQLAVTEMTVGTWRRHLVHSLAPRGPIRSQNACSLWVEIYRVTAQLRLRLSLKPAGVPRVRAFHIPAPALGPACTCSSPAPGPASAQGPASCPSTCHRLPWPCPAEVPHPDLPPTRLKTLGDAGVALPTPALEASQWGCPQHPAKKPKNGPSSGLHPPGQYKKSNTIKHSVRCIL